MAGSLLNLLAFIAPGFARFGRSEGLASRQPKGVFAAANPRQKRI